MGDVEVQGSVGVHFQIRHKAQCQQQQCPEQHIYFLHLHDKEYPQDQQCLSQVNTYTTVPKGTSHTDTRKTGSRLDQQNETKH
jgi:beta-lactamase class D